MSVCGGYFSSPRSQDESVPFQALSLNPKSQDRRSKGTASNLQAESAQEQTQSLKNENGH